MRMQAQWIVALGLTMASGAWAQDPEDPEDEHVPSQRASSIEEGRRSGRSYVLGTGSRSRRASTATPELYTVRPGDTLWDITGRYFGDPYQWPRIWSYNPEVTNPHWIYPPDRLRLLPEGAAPAQATLATSARAPRQAQSGTVWLRQLGFLDDEADRDAGVIIGSPEEHMLLSDFDEVYVRFEDEAEVRPGQSYTVFREIDQEEREPEESGTLVRLFGTVQLRSYDADRNIGRGTITESLDPIERGFRIAPIPRRFDVVPPRENAEDLESEVIAALRPLQIHADSQIVFVGVGGEQGVQLGNRFFVVREGDEWRENLHSGSLEYGEVYPDAPRPSEDEYPTEVIAEGRVVDVRDETATLYITRSIAEVELGDRVEMRRGF